MKNKTISKAEKLSLTFYMRHLVVGKRKPKFTMKQANYTSFRCEFIIAQY